MYYLSLIRVIIIVSLKQTLLSRLFLLHNLLLLNNTMNTLINNKLLLTLPPTMGPELAPIPPPQAPNATIHPESSSANFGKSGPHPSTFFVIL